jgi:hypothetical protein
LGDKAKKKKKPTKYFSTNRIKEGNCQGAAVNTGFLGSHEILDHAEAPKSVTGHVM